MEEVTPNIAEETTEVFSDTTEPAPEEIVATEEVSTPEPEVVAPTKTKNKKTSQVEPEPEQIVATEEPKPLPTIVRSGSMTIARSNKTN